MPALNCSGAVKVLRTLRNVDSERITTAHCHSKKYEKLVMRVGGGHRGTVIIGNIASTAWKRPRSHDDTEVGNGHTSPSKVRRVKDQVNNTVHITAKK